MSYLGESETVSLEAIIDESKSPNIVYSKVDGADWIVEELGLTEDEIVSKIEEFFGDENWDIASKYLDKYVEVGLIDRLTKVLTCEFKRVPYKECIEILQKSGKDFEFEPVYGADIAKEHEKYLTDYFKCPF